MLRFNISETFFFHTYAATWIFGSKMDPCLYTTKASNIIDRLVSGSSKCLFWIYDLKECTFTNFQKKKKRLDRIISANKKVNLKWKIFDPTVNFSQISCHNSGTISSLDLKFSVFYFDNTYQW